MSCAGLETIKSSKAEIFPTHLNEERERSLIKRIGNFWRQVRNSCFETRPDSWCCCFAQKESNSCRSPSSDPNGLSTLPTSPDTGEFTSFPIRIEKREKCIPPRLNLDRISSNGPNSFEILRFCTGKVGEGSRKSSVVSSSEVLLSKEMAYPEVNPLKSAFFRIKNENSSLLREYQINKKSWGDKKKIHILIADDTPINQKILLYAFRSMGQTDCICVDNGELASKAVESSLADPWDLIIMDLEMPVANGKEAAERIRKCVGKNIIIVYYSTESLSLKEARDFGFDYVLPKSFKREGLRSLLEADFPAAMRSS